ncbi:MAG: hypothetical protein CR972_03185 [Candidatus Moraniibacteriota bacterium]|nr:MAG: hypothetical protein CR972_03185 [Candidatus Moranbacteria bacterium]
MVYIQGLFLYITLLFKNNKQVFFVRRYLVEKIWLTFFLLLLFFALVQIVKSRACFFAIYFVLLGSFSNVLVSHVNGGKMPVFFDHVSSHYVDRVIESDRHQNGNDDTKLAFLSDIIVLNKIGHIISVGDVLIFLALITPFFILVRRSTYHFLITRYMYPILL